jgi:hypothetical protein
MPAASNPELENQRAAPNSWSQAASFALTLPLPEEKTSRDEKQCRCTRATTALSGSVKVLLDACVPRPLRKFLTDHSIHTAQEMGWGQSKC